MINKNILILSALCSCCSLWADEVVVRHYNYAGPYEVKKPFLADSLDVNSKRFSDKELLNTTVPFCNLSQSGQTLDAASSGELTLPTSASSYALHLVSFYLNSDRYTKGTLRINGPEISEVYVDGQLTKLTQGEASLTLVNASNPPACPRMENSLSSPIKKPIPAESSPHLPRY